MAVGFTVSIRVSVLTLLGVVTGGCVVPVSGESPDTTAVRTGTAHLIDPRAARDMARIGTTKDAVHQSLAGIPRTLVPATEDGPPWERYDFINRATDLWLAAWHGPYTWGFHPRWIQYSLWVSYDENELVHICILGEPSETWGARPSPPSSPNERP